MKLLPILLLFSIVASSQDVFIHGTVHDYKYEIIPFFKKDYTTFQDIHIKEKKFENNYYEFQFHNPKPQLFKLLLEWVYIEPGDSVQFDFSFVDISPTEFRDSIKVKAKYPGNYTFYNQLKFWSFDKPKFKANTAQAAESYYQSLKDFYFNILLERMKQYIKENPVSPRFFNYINKELHIRFLTDLLQTLKENNVVLSSQLESKIKREIDVSNITNEELLDCEYYVYFGYLYLEYFLPKNNKESKTFDNYLYLKKTIEKQFDGRLREFWMSLLVRSQYFNKPAIYNSKEDSLTNAILLSVKDSSIRESISHFVFKYANRNEEEVKKIRLIDQNNKVVTIGQVIEQDSGAVKLIDFWATWCGPCLQESKKMEELKDELKNVKVIKISVDREQEKWRQAVKANTHSDQRQFLIENEEEEKKLQSLIDLNGIPRFLIVTQKGKIAFFQAFSPSNQNLFLQQIKDAGSMDELLMAKEERKGIPKPSN